VLRFAVVIDMPLLLKQGSFCPSFSVVVKYKISFFLDMPFPNMTVVANVIAGCKSDVVEANKHVNKSN